MEKGSASKESRDVLETPPTPAERERERENESTENWKYTATNMDAYFFSTRSTLVLPYRFHIFIFFNTALCCQQFLPSPLVKEPSM